MKLDLKELERIHRKYIDDEDLAEDFAFFVEDHLDINSHDGFLRTVVQLPEPMLNAYLPWHADLQIRSGGLPGLFNAFDIPEIREALFRGLRAICELELAALVEEAWQYEETAQSLSLPDLDKHTNDYHVRYFALNSGLQKSVGCYLRENKDWMLNL